MNQGNFQNMGVPRPAPQGIPQPGGMQRNGPASSDIRQHILRELSSHPTPTGWQQTIPPQNRVPVIQQIITQLSLVKPEYNLTKTFGIATSFEKEKFEQSPDRLTYEAHCRTQLKRIFDTRQSQAEQQQQFLNPQQPQMALMQQQMAMQGMNQNQFPQAYPIPQQAHMQNLGNPMQHHPSQSQRPVQSANPMEMQQQMANGQPVPNMAQRGPQNQGQPQFTPQEQQQIMQLAESMAHNASPEQMNNVQRLVMSIPAGQRQQMQSQGINPAHAVFRQHAIKRFLQDKAVQQQRAGQGPHPLDRGGVVSQQGRPTSQISMRQGQQVPPPPTPQHHEPSFDQFLGQQQDALRHQEAGQVVVPASQGAPPQVRGTSLAQPQGQFGARPMQPPNNFQQQPPAVWNTPQGQHQNVPQTPQPQVPPQTSNLANMPGQTPQQQALQGQLGGLDNNRAQRTPQQNPNMPTLNRPLNPPNQVQNGQRQAQPTPKISARNVPNGQQTAVANGQASVGQHSAPVNLQQQKFQKYVASMPEAQRAVFIAEFKQRQERRKAEEAAEVAAQAGPSGAPVAPMGGQGAKAQPGPKAIPSAAQPSMNPINRLNGQAQIIQQSGPPSGARGPQQKFAPISLDENATRIMDRVEFPRTLLNVAGDNAKVPEHIKQWGQLKQWVHKNSNILPPGSIHKVVGLQSIVYQQRVAQNNQREALNQAQSHGNTRPAQPGVAPAAQMVAPSSIQTPIQGFTAQAPNSSMPVLPPPTIQEVAAARAQLPDNMKTASDEQLREMISNKRRNDYFKAMQGQQSLTQQQQEQQKQHQQRMNMLRIQQQANAQQAQSVQPNQHSQLQPSQRGQNQQPQPGQQWPQPQMAQNISQPNPQQAKQPQSSRSGPQASVPQPNHKNGKRNNNSDDVIEVPDPKLSQQTARPPNIKGPQPPPQPPPNNVSSQITPEKYNSLPPEAKARFQEQRRSYIEATQRASAQQSGQNAQRQRPAEAVIQNVVPNAGRDGRVKELRSEVMRSMPTRQPIPMSPSTRARMIEQLKNAGIMSQRLEQSLPLYLSLSKDEDRTKDLLRSRIAVQQQLKETQSGDTNPVDNFTMSLEELESIQTKLHEYFQFMMKAKVPKTGVPVPPVQNPPRQQLSAANLQSQQEALSKARAANLPKSHANNSNRAPAAPTTSHAPFSFGGQSPQGVPQFYGPTKNELTQEKLILPVTKKRKSNNVASPSTPAQAPTPAAANKLSPFGKTDSPDAQRTPAVTPMIKCPIAHCETGIAGFPTKTDLEKHIADTHEPKEPVIKDPLDAAAYAIESMRLALNLDQDGRSKPLQEQRVEPMQAQAMKASLSAQGQSSVKQEAATPMSRNPTQTGPSPSSNLLKTPQTAANIKTPASDAKSTGKEIKAIALAKSPAAAAPDPWANSHVKPEWFKQVFSEVADLNRPVSNDLIIDWLERNPFTPSTSPSSGVPSKDSPHKSDISANDTLNINVNGDDWLPPEWFDDGLPSDMAALDVGDFMDMDWEATFGKPEEGEEVLAKGKRRRERDPLEASDEWLKAWAPDRWEGGKNKDAERKN